MTDATAIAAALAAVRATVDELAQRADVVFLHRRFGEPASAELLRRFAGGDQALPAELLALYGLTNGLRVEWQWRGGEPGGSLHLPPLRPDSFTTNTDLRHDQQFGRLLRVLLHPTLPDWGFYLAADQPEPQLYLRTDGGASDFGWAAASLTAALERLAATYFSENWHYHEQQEYVPQYVAPLLTRLAQPAAPQLPIEPGTRVVLNTDWSSQSEDRLRGEVLELRDLPSGSELLADLKRRDAPPTYALLRLDVTGRPCWMPLERLRPVPADDAYEYFWADPARLLTLGETEGWEVALRRMALAWGPMGGISNFYADRWEYPAALLGRFPLAEAFELVRRMVEQAEPVIATLPKEGMVLTEDERAQVLFPAAWAESYRQWQGPWDGPLEVLLAGLICRVYFAEPAERKTIRPASIKGLQAAREPSDDWWPSARDFYKYLKIFIGNKYLGIGTPSVSGFYPPHPDLPGEFDRFYALLSDDAQKEDELWTGA